MNECEDFACDDDDDDDDGASSSFVCVDFVGRWALKSLYSCSPSRSSSYTQSLHGLGMYGFLFSTRHSFNPTLFLHSHNNMVEKIPFSILHLSKKGSFHF